jgi:hypothetical protein
MMRVYIGIWDDMAMVNESRVFPGFQTVFDTNDGFFKAAYAAGQPVDQGAIETYLSTGGTVFLRENAMTHGIARGYNLAPVRAGTGGFCPWLRQADKIGLSLAGFRGPAGHITQPPDRRNPAGFV